MRLMSRKPFIEKIRDADEAGVQFCLTDAETGLIFLNLTDAPPESRDRRIEEALKTYRTILHLLEGLKPSSSEQAALRERLDLLRERLVIAGIPLASIEPAST
jgi:hypothetical protein